MSERFSVGDVALIVESVQTGWVGKEVTILSGLVERPLGLPPGYQISDPNGTDYECYAPPRHLRKKRPPREQTSTWDDVIVWRPKEIERVAG